MKILCKMYDWADSCELPDIGVGERYYINYGGAMRQVAVQKVDVKCVRKIRDDGALGDTISDFAVDVFAKVAGIDGTLMFKWDRRGNWYVLNGKKYALHPEPTIKSVCVGKFSKKLSEILDDCFQQKVGTIARINGWKELRRFAWDGVKPVSTPVYIPDTFTYDRNGFHAYDGCEVTHNTWATREECENANTVKVITFNEADENELKINDYVIAWKKICQYLHKHLDGKLIQNVEITHYIVGGCTSCLCKLMMNKDNSIVVEDVNKNCIASFMWFVMNENEFAGKDSSKNWKYLSIGDMNAENTTKAFMDGIESMTSERGWERIKENVDYIIKQRNRIINFNAE